MIRMNIEEWTAIQKKLKEEATRCLMKRIKQGFSGNALIEKLKRKGGMK